MPPVPDAPPDNPDPHTASLAPQSIVWINSAAVVRRGDVTKAPAVLFGWGAILGVAAFAANRFVPAVVWWIVAALLIAAAVGVIYRLLSLERREQWRKSTAGLDRQDCSGPNVSPDRLVQRLLMQSGGPANPRAWDDPRGPDGNEFQDALAAAGLPAALTIVDAGLKSAVDRIEITDNLLEPEPIDSRPSVRTFTNWYAVILLGIAMVLIGVDSIPHLEWSGIALTCGLAIWWLFNVLRLMGLRVLESTAPVCGPGYVENSARNKRWTVNDSCLFVTQKTPWAKLLVEFVGPSGHTAMLFDNPTDQGFIALWQRWRHPHPRLELADEL